MTTTEEYGELLAQHCDAIIGHSELLAEIEQLTARDEVLGRLGDMFARRASPHLVERINQGVERLGESLEYMRNRGASGSGAGNVLVGLSNLQIAVDSNVARSHLGDHTKWVIEGLTSSGAARLFDQILPDLTDMLTHDWNAACHGMSVGYAIHAAQSLERPDDVGGHPPHELELGAVLGPIGDAMGLLYPIQPSERGDGSVRSAEWLGIGLVEADTPVGGGEDQLAGSTEAPARPPLAERVDLDAIRDANQTVCKSATSSMRLQFRAKDYVVCIGTGHGALWDELSGEQGFYEGTVSVRSATFGAGSMIFTGVPPVQQENVKWAVGQFSRKEVVFA